MVSRGPVVSHGVLWRRRGAHVQQTIKLAAELATPKNAPYREMQVGRAVLRRVVSVCTLYIMLYRCLVLLRAIMLLQSGNAIWAVLFSPRSLSRS